MPESSRLPAAPVFVVCNARSGSTLLRYLLDSHPDVAVPAETKIAHVARLLLAVENDLAGNATVERIARKHGVPDPAPEAVAAVRDVVGTTMAGYLTRRGKTVWCDKSLDTVMTLDVLRLVFPDARFICLHRHAMDVVASLLESCRWGYAYFEVQPYVARRLNNVPMAFAEYWAQRTAIMLQLENSDAPTLSVHYEHLVRDPVATVTRILEFLDLPRDDSVVRASIAAAFRGEHDPGAADWKIPYATAVEAHSVERGRAISEAMMIGPLRDQVNALLARLRYPVVGTDWNTSSQLGPRVDRTLLSTGAPATRVGALIEALMPARLAAYRSVRGSDAGPDVVGLVLTHGDGARTDWTVDVAGATVAAGRAPETAPTITTRAEVLRELLVGGLNAQLAVNQEMAVVAGARDEAQTRAIGRLFTALTAG